MTIDWMASLGWMPSSQQMQQFERFYQLLLVANQSLNLTRITHPDEFWEKHLWDSLTGIVPWLALNPQNQWPEEPIFSIGGRKVIDIGTGGGFPGLPVAIACPQWRVSLLDATKKKMNCLSELITALGLQTVSTICNRAETLGQQAGHRELYDLALIRAVAAAPVCAEYTVPLLRNHGVAVLYRGHWDIHEERALCQALGLLGGEIAQVKHFKTPISGSDRHCVYLKKITPTPGGYPRRVGVPTKKPLG